MGERLHDALDAFRDVFGASTPNLEDLVDLGGIQMLLDIKDAAEDLYASPEDEAQQTLASTSSVGLTLFEAFPVCYGGITYQTAFNAFQAQKAPDDERESYCNVDTQTALNLGRKCTIDVAAWDSRRVSLMRHILKKQAQQNLSFKDRIVEHGGRDDILHDAMFWSA